MLKTDSPLALRSVRAEEFLPPISRWTTWGGIVLLNSVGIAIALSAVLKYNTTVRAAATVRPSGEVRIVQAEMDGSIESIEVESNQTVQQGDVIARLDRSRLETQQTQLQSSIQQSQLQLVQMDAQVQLLETQIAAERRSLDQEIAVAQSELDRNQRDYGTQQATTQADLSEAQAALTFARSEMQRYEQLVGAGATSQLQLEEKQAAVRTAEAQVARAEAALNPSQASVAIAQARINQAESVGRAMLATLNRERETLMQRRSEIQTQLVRDQQELRQLEIELRRSVIRATSDGTVLRLNLRNVNQVVQSGDTIVEIAPSDTALVIKAAIATQDIDNVKLEQPVRLRINACPFPDYGTLGGTVTAISADAIAPRIESAAPTSGSSESAFTTNYYEVTIKPEQTSLTAGSRQCQLQAGMEAEANIIARQESFLQFALRKARLVTNL